MNLQFRRMLVGAATLASLPHLVRTPWVVMITASALLLWTILASLYSWRYPSRWLHGVMALGAGVVIWSGYRTLLGLEPGMGLLVMILTLKLFEQNERRDQIVAIWLIALLVVGELIVTQNLITTVLGILGAVVVLTLLLFMNLPQDSLGQVDVRRQAFRFSRQVLVTSVPITALLFAVFPRLNINILGGLANAPSAQIGFNDELRPGEVAQLAKNKEAAFRVTFKNNVNLENRNLYWRGAVLSATDGFNWLRAPRRTPPSATDQVNVPTIEQEIVLEPHSNRWLFALDKPQMIFLQAGRGRPVGARYGAVYESEGRVTQRLAYKAESVLEAPTTSLSPQERERETRVRANFSPRLLELARRIGSKGKDAESIAQAIHHYFLAEKFRYSLSPGVMATLDDFLFSEQKLGFCEHFASAAGILLRLNGIPARVVVGFQGGEKNPYGGYYSVRYQDAHAWVEVWSETKGWFRFDPIESIAPDRLGLGAQGLADLTVGADSSARRSLASQDGPRDWRWLLSETVFFIDSVNSRWNVFLLSYDLDFQKSLLQTIDKGRPSWQLFAFVAIAVVLLIAIILGIVFWQRTIASDPVVVIYNDFCRQLAARKVKRAFNEGPLDFCRRSASAFPERAQEINQAIKTYIELRYGAVKASRTDLAKFRHEVRQVFFR